jgi:hypothetical protein
MSPAVKLALTTGLVVAAIELPVSQYYATVPPTNTAKRMVIAGGMGLVGVMVAGYLLKALRA